MLLVLLEVSTPSTEALGVLGGYGGIAQKGFRKCSLRLSEVAVGIPVQ